MAGNSNSGRKAVPKAKLALYGSKHADTKGDAIETALDGLPERPACLTGEAAMLWDSIVPQLEGVGIVKRIDTTQLWAMCELWGLYRAAMKYAEAVPLDKPTRAAVISYKAAFDAIACKYGLTSADRQKLEIAPQQKRDEFSEFLGKQIG
jgi:phage terminase small subunit